MKGENNDRAYKPVFFLISPGDLNRWNEPKKERESRANILEILKIVYVS